MLGRCEPFAHLWRSVRNPVPKSDSYGFANCNADLNPRESNTNANHPDSDTAGYRFADDHSRSMSFGHHPFHKPGDHAAELRLV